MERLPAICVIAGRDRGYADADQNERDYRALKDAVVGRIAAETGL